jgi:hypothetical protein
LTRSEWTPEAYNQSLYQLDETIKLCIRAAHHTPREQVRDVWQCITQMLPSEDSALEALDMRYAWGMWFQLLWALLRLHDRDEAIADRQNMRAILDRNIDIVRRHGYAQTFLTELDNPDYADFRSRLRELGRT